jgi:hypothetical protein
MCSSLNVYPSISTLYSILWNQILSYYTQHIHSFVQAPIKQIARRILKIDEESFLSVVSLFPSPSICNAYLFSYLFFSLT